MDHERVMATVGPSLLKLGYMADVYLTRHSTSYSEADARAVRDSVAALQWKMQASAYHLEWLWRHSFEARYDVLALLEIRDRSEWTDGQRFEAAVHLEAYILQARAYLDFYFHLVCRVLLCSDVPHMMSTRKFRATLLRAPASSAPRAAAIGAYVQDQVLAPGQWGAVMRSLRSKILHADRLKHGRASTESVAGVSLDWPTIRGLTFDRLAQGFDNGRFELLRETAPILFEIPWQSGPFRRMRGTEAQVRTRPTISRHATPASGPECRYCRFSSTDSTTASSRCGLSSSTRLTTPASAAM